MPGIDPGKYEINGSAVTDLRIIVEVRETYDGMQQALPSGDHQHLTRQVAERVH